ncbi:hypothetical protein HHI36_021944, partial [Cryptolaemus montrouzieri]
ATRRRGRLPHLWRKAREELENGAPSAITRERKNSRKLERTVPSTTRVVEASCSTDSSEVAQPETNLQTHEDKCLECGGKQGTKECTVPKQRYLNAQIAEAHTSQILLILINPNNPDQKYHAGRKIQPSAVVNSWQKRTEERKTDENCYNKILGRTGAGSGKDEENTDDRFVVLTKIFLYNRMVWSAT